MSRNVANTPNSNQYVNPIALGHIKWKYYIVYDVWLVVELVVVYFFYIETRYTPLEEIAKHNSKVRFSVGDSSQSY